MLAGRKSFSWFSSSSFFIFAPALSTTAEQYFLVEPAMTFYTNIAQCVCVDTEERVALKNVLKKKLAVMR